MNKSLRHLLIVIMIFALIANIGCESERLDFSEEFPFLGISIGETEFQGERLIVYIEEVGTLPAYVACTLLWPSKDDFNMTERVSASANIDISSQSQPVNRRGTYIFPVESVDAIWNIGAIPIINWEPVHYDPETEKHIMCDGIETGDYDEYLRDFARQLASWKKPVLMNFLPKMNLSGSFWIGEFPSDKPCDPKSYVENYRRIVDIFREEKAENALWIFCPAAKPAVEPQITMAEVWNNPTPYYPGDDYIDIFGMSGFEMSQADLSDKSFNEIFSSLHAELISLSPEKPIMVCEMACSAALQDREKWLQEAISGITGMKLLGALWFQVDEKTNWKLNPAIGARHWTNSRRRPAEKPAVHLWTDYFLKHRKRDIKFPVQ